MLKNYAVTIAVSAVVAFFLFYFLFAYSGIMLSVESGYQIGDISRWCERISSGYFREPSNALSNIGFILTGIFMVWILSREEVTGQNFFIGFTSISVLYASASRSSAPPNQGSEAGSSYRGSGHGEPLGFELLCLDLVG